MVARLWRVLHPLLTLSVVACCAWLVWRDQHRPNLDRLSTHADFPVRNFLDLHWLGGDYELPVGENHCVVMILEFEDGKFRGRRSGTKFSPKSGESRVVPFYVMWGRGHEGTRVISGWPGMWSASQNDKFFANIDSGYSRVYGPDTLGEIRGYRVIGFAVSSQLRAGSEKYRDQFGGLDFSIQNRQFVAVLGVKTFSTAQEADSWLLNSREQPDQ